MMEQPRRHFERGTVDEPYGASDQRLGLHLQAASSSFEIWRHIAIADRAVVVCSVAQILHRRANEFARLISMEGHTSLNQARDEVMLTTNRLQDYAACTERMLAFLNLPDSPGKAWSEHLPIGVVIGVSRPDPVRPLYQLARFFGPNVMAGNSVMVQHPAPPPPSAIAFDGLWREAGGLPGMYTNLELSIDQADMLSRDPRVKRIVPLTHHIDALGRGLPQEGALPRSRRAPLT